ncbi:hypothetical protein [uncultured Prevotella sp.]|uniref:hypothetical protein n=1 Tax=uncultured Prevotella sp. TaxID=159272 RepID=UPI002676735A|nr:hypothetical protein [uncultured Prevotella sp.]
MKKLLLIMFAVMAFTAQTSAQSVDIPFYGDYLQLQVKDVNEDTVSGNPPSRTPIKGPSIGLCSNTLYLFGQFNNIVLRLVDNDIAIYSIDIPAGANEVELPADMQGIYELQLDDGKYIYYCEIEIE